VGTLNIASTVHNVAWCRWCEQFVFLITLLLTQTMLYHAKWSFLRSRLADKTVSGFLDLTISQPL